MKKRGLNLTFKFSNRILYSLITVFILAIIGVGVYAYGTSAPSTFGHSLGEIAPPTTCSSPNNFLRWSGTAWECAAAGTGGGSSQWTTSGNDISFLTAGAVETTGNVGIGTANPGNKLEVNSISEGTGIRIGNGAPFYFDIGRNADTGALTIQGAQLDANNIVLAPTSGKVGIGTTTPGSTLTLGSGSTFSVEMNRVTDASAMPFSFGGSMATGTYYFKVVAEDGSGGTTLPSPETNCVVDATSNNGRCDLIWTAIPGVYSYRVYSGATPNGENKYFTTSNNRFSWTTNGNAISGTPPIANSASGSFKVFSDGKVGINQVYYQERVPGSNPPNPMPSIRFVSESSGCSTPSDFGKIRLHVVREYGNSERTGYASDLQACIGVWAIDDTAYYPRDIRWASMIDGVIDNPLSGRSWDFSPTNLLD